MIGTTTGLGEDQHAVDRILIENGLEHLRFLCMLDHHQSLFDQFDRGGFGGGLDSEWLGEQRVGQAVDVP